MNSFLAEAIDECELEERCPARVLASSVPLEKFQENFACEKCGELEGWLPRAPGINEADLKNWRCVKCKPSPNPSIVAKRCGPLWMASEAERVSRESSLSESASKSIVVAVESVACGKCKGKWVIERPTTDGVEWNCWSCRSPIDADVFYRATTERAPWRDQVKRRWKASRNRMDVDNGSGEKMASQH